MRGNLGTLAYQHVQGTAIFSGESRHSTRMIVVPKLYLLKQVVINQFQWSHLWTVMPKKKPQPGQQFKFEAIVVPYVKTQGESYCLSALTIKELFDV